MMMMTRTMTMMMIETLKYCSLKPTMLSTFVPKIKKKCPSYEQRVYKCVLSANKKQKKKQSDSWISTRTWQSFY